MKKLTNLLAVLALSVLGTSIAQAHTTSIGFFNAGAGAVTFVTGSYSHGGTPVNEGALTLTGINGTTYAATTQAFNIAPTNVKDSRLVDGVNNFYWGQPFGSALDTSILVDPNIAGGVVWWQATTFTGLSAGDYSFTCGTNCGVTAQWDSWGAGVETVTLSGTIVNGVPEASSLILLGLGLAGLGFSRRKKQA